MANVQVITLNKDNAAKAKEVLEDFEKAVLAGTVVDSTHYGVITHILMSFEMRNQ